MIQCYNAAVAIHFNIALFPSIYCTISLFNCLTYIVVYIAHSITTSADGSSKKPKRWALVSASIAKIKKGISGYNNYIS